MGYLFNLSLVLLSIIAIIILTSRIKMHSFVALFGVSLILAFLTIPPETVVSKIQEGFGKTVGSIGFLIILGAIIGITLDKTGGIISLANYSLEKIGKKRAVAAIGFTGFIAGLPIFCDSGFIIMSNLAKSFSFKARIALPFIATVLATSLYSVHCLIPTHPGILAGAEIMNANIGYLIILGILFAIPGAVAAYFWSRFMTKGKNYPPAEESSEGLPFSKENLPPVLLSLLPILVPLVLIMISSVLKIFYPGTSHFVIEFFKIAGQPVLALLAGVLFAMLLLEKGKSTTLNEIFNVAIEKAGPILIITGAGGMFGMIITSTGIGEETGRILSVTGLGLLVPFLIALFLKTAQGSSTVATITAASLLAPMLGMLGLDSEWGRLFALLSIGAGSMVFSHANDSYFWVVSKFSGLDVNTMLRVYSTTTAVMGVVIFAFVWLTSLLVL